MITYFNLTFFKIYNFCIFCKSASLMPLRALISLSSFHENIFIYFFIFTTFLFKKAFGCRSVGSCCGCFLLCRRWTNDQEGNLWGLLRVIDKEDLKFNTFQLNNAKQLKTMPGEHQFPVPDTAQQQSPTAPSNSVLLCVRRDTNKLSDWTVKQSNEESSKDRCGCFK